VRCPKCGGRTISEDVHTYLGQQLERKCISCGKRFVEPIASVQLEVQALVPPVPQSKSIGTCEVCRRPNVYLTRGMCPKHYQQWRRDNAEGAAVKTESPWRKQLYDRAELAKHEAKQDQQDPTPAAAAAPKEVKPVGRKATCVECQRPDMAIVAKGLCGRCFTRGVKAGTDQVKHRKPAAAPEPAALQLDPEHPLAGPAVPPPAADVPPEEHEAEQPSAKLEMAYEDENEKAALAGAAIQAPVPESAPPVPEVQPANDDNLGLLTFDNERDLKLLSQLETSAGFNRRTLASEILYRLERSYDANP